MVAELTNGMILRAGFEEVQGQVQGWIAPLRQEIGSVNRVLQAPDGTVFCGLTNRGWGGRAPADGLVRVRRTAAEAMDLAGMTLLDFDEETESFGFEVAFNHPVHADWAPTAERVKMISYDYDYWWEYGSPERHVTELELSDVRLSEDRTRLIVRSYDIFPATCVRITMDGIQAESGAPLLHPEVSYTVNQLPSGALTNAYVSKVVPPPPSRGEADAGVLRLSWGDALGQFEAEGWELVDATLDPEDKRRFKTGVGNGALVNAGPGATDLVTRGSFGDAHVHVEFMLPEDSASGVELGNLGRLNLFPDPEICGGFMGNGVAVGPTSEAFGEAGEWYPPRHLLPRRHGREPRLPRPRGAQRRHRDRGPRGPEGRRWASPHPLRRHQGRGRLQEHPGQAAGPPRGRGRVGVPGRRRVLGRLGARG